MKLSEATKRLSDAGIENARGEAIMLFEHFGGFRKSDLLVGNPESCSDELCAAISLRETREPLQYILGECPFYRENYLVNENCLIPRSDTEILVDYAVRHIPEGKKFLDLCTGSGCVAISTLKNTKNTHATAVDLSAAALEIAKENAKLNLVSEKIDLRLSDALSERISGDFYAVLSNPPYVTEKAYEGLEPELYREPRMALVAGDGGLEFYKRITSLYRDAFSDGGFIAYEIGYDQGEALKKIAEENELSCEIIKDFSGNDRVAVLRRY